jgi:hypothetical protein
MAINIGAGWSVGPGWTFIGGAPSGSFITTLAGDFITTISGNFLITI